MAIRKLLIFVIGLLLFFAIVVGVISINHPIILKWLSGSARLIGKLTHATVYTDGKINQDIKVYHIDKYWNSNKKANCYLLNLGKYESFGRLAYLNVNLNEKWIGKPAAVSKRDYDFIAGQLFQSETGGHFTPFQDDMKGFDFDPRLSFNMREIKFSMPPNTVGFDSIRIELQ